MRDWDVVVWGATGFTGQLICRYLAQQVQSGRDIKWAIGGRNHSKLQAVLDEVRAELGEGSAKGVHIFVAELTDSAALAAIAGTTRVILSAAGPFTRYGTPIVDACVAVGTHYTDITGEIPWVKQMIDKHHETARAKGLGIVPMCGFDSIPSDVGTLWIASALKSKTSSSVRKVTSHVLLKGSMSGGTVASSIVMAKEFPNEMKQPFLLGGAPPPSATISDDVIHAEFDENLKIWTAPFPMAKINTRVVRRSHHLLSLAGLGYGPTFEYQERCVAGSEKAATKLARAESVPAHVLERMVSAGALFQPGQGPSKADRARARFMMILTAEDETGQTLTGSISGKDAGYDETAKFVAEAAILLAKTGIRPESSGVVTPAIAFGLKMVDALVAANIRFQLHRNGFGEALRLWASEESAAKL